MHELSLTEKILKLVLQTAVENKANRVTHVRMVIGDLSGIVETAVVSYFELIAKGTIAEGAQLEFTKEHTTLYCHLCQKDYPKQPGDFLCPVCKTLGRLNESGRECFVNSIEVENDGN